MLKIIISGGGTGGHIFPALAIANAIKELLPLLSSGQTREATQIIIDDFEKFKMEKQNDNSN
mgnify:CR=1 FL=1